MANITVLALGAGVAVLAGLTVLAFVLLRRRAGREPQAGDGPDAHGPFPPPPAPRPDKIGATEALVDVFGLVGEALVLDNGTFVRMIEVSPVDLERGNPALKARYWSLFADALRSVRAPLGLQLVVTTRPQDIAPYLQRWEAALRDWRVRAEQSSDPAAAARRSRMARGALETAAHLIAAYERLLPMQRRYLLVVFHNPFPESKSKKTRQHILNPRLATRALEQLEENVQLVKAAFARLGLALHDLDPAAMCAAVWEHYHHPPNVLGDVAPPEALLSQEQNGYGAPDARLAVSEKFAATSEALRECPTPEQFLAAAADPAQLADLLAPAMIDNQPGYIRVGDVVARGYVLYDFDTRTEVDLSALLATAADMTHALYLAPADPVAIRQQFKEKETELKSGQLVDARRGAVTNWGRQAAIQTVEAARAEIETALQAPFFLNWYCLVWANDLPALEKKCRQFETVLKTRDIRFHRGTRVQQGVLQSTRPLARMAYKLKPRNMTADSLGPLFPFSRREYFQPAGWHFGVHRGNGMLVCLDPFQAGRSNASELVLGTPGGGKSVYMKQTIDTLLALGQRVFVIDPESEYLRTAVDYHAPYIELGKGQSSELITLDPGAHGQQAWVQGLETLARRYQALSAAELSEAQLGALARHYQAVMTAAGLPPDEPETWQRAGPPLDTLVAQLNAEAEGREVGRVLGYIGGALGGGSQINLMDINLDSAQPWQDAAQSLAAFVEVALGDRDARLHPSEFSALASNYKATMERWGFDQDDPGTWGRRAPTLSALYDMLAASREAGSAALAAVLKEYAYGLYADMFNVETTVDLSQAQFAVFGMRALRENTEKSLAPVFAWLVLRLVWNTVVAYGAVQPIHLFVDEAWFLLRQRGAAARLEQMARSFRKHNAALHLATQATEELAASREATAIGKVAGMTMLFGQETDQAVRDLARIFKLSPAEQDGILHAGKGEALLLGGNKLRLPLYVAVNPNRMEFLASNIAQQQAIAVAAGRNRKPVL